MFSKIWVNNYVFQVVKINHTDQMCTIVQTLHMQQNPSFLVTGPIYEFKL